MSEVRRFEVERCLGRGGFGEVYLALMRSTGGLETQVALKVLRPELDLQDDAVRRLRDEGRMLARVQHPSILKVYDLVALEGRVCLVTEYVEGQDLRDCQGELPRRALLQAVSGVASALSAAWNGRGDGGAPLHLVHRDVKPSNIRLGRHGQVVLLDFGIARTDNLEREARTRSDLVVGSLPFMAPERFFSRPLGAAADVFGLGAVLYGALAGRRFHPSVAMRDLARLAADAERFEEHLQQALAALPHGLDPDLRSVLEVALAHDPAIRPSADELSRRVEAAAERSGGRTLAAWSRDRAWPDPPSLDAPLVGRTLVEGAAPGPVSAPVAPQVVLAPDITRQAPAAPTPTPTTRPIPHQPPAPRRPWLLAAGLALGLATLGLVLLLGGAGLGLFLWSGPEPASPGMVQELSPEIVLPPPEALPSESPPPRIAAPVEGVEQVRLVAPVRIQVGVSGPALVELRRQGRHYLLPAEVPPGSYEVWADHGQGMTLATTLVLEEADRAARVSCAPQGGCSATR